MHQFVTCILVTDFMIDGGVQARLEYFGAVSYMNYIHYH